LTDTPDNQAGTGARPSRSGRFVGRISDELQKRAVTYVVGLIVLGLGALVLATWTEIRRQADAFAVAAVISELENPNSRIAAVLTDRLEADLARPTSRMSRAVDARIAQRIDSNVGAVVAGSFELHDADPRFTIPFYLPADHLVDLELYVSGLEEQQGEVLRITTRNPQDLPISSGTIAHNGPGRLPSLRQPSAEARDNPDLNPLGTTFQRIMGRVEHLFPVTITLTRSEAEPIGREPLQSRVTVEYVGLLSPPIQRP
jgi:hypothetical protein